MIGEEKGKIKILKATVDRGAEEQYRYPEVPFCFVWFWCWWLVGWLWFLLVCGSGGVGIVATVGRSCSLPAAGTRVLPLARKGLAKKEKNNRHN